MIPVLLNQVTLCEFQKWAQEWADRFPNRDRPHNRGFRRRLHRSESAGYLTYLEQTGRQSLGRVPNYTLKRYRRMKAVKFKIGYDSLHEFFRLPERLEELSAAMRRGVKPLLRVT